MDYKNRIKSLEKKYSTTNINKGEELTKETISQINKEYHKKLRKRQVDSILALVNNRDSIKQEVHDIINDYGLKGFCRNCKAEVIISCVILYVCKTRNRKFDIEHSGLWKRYDLNWKVYSNVVTKLSMKSREERKIRTNKHYVDNEDFIQW